MDLQKLNSTSLLVEKPIVKLCDLTPNVPIPIFGAKLVKTKFGESILLELDDFVTFLPRRVVTHMKNNLEKFIDGNFSIVFEGLKDVHMPFKGVLFKFIDSE